MKINLANFTRIHLNIRKKNIYFYLLAIKLNNVIKILYYKLKKKKETLIRLLSIPYNK